MTGAPWDEPTPLHDTEPEPLAGWTGPEPKDDAPGTDLAVVVPADLLRLDDPLALSQLLVELRAGLTDRVVSLMADARTRRGTTAKGSAADLLAEFRAASAAHDALDGVARVLGDVRRDVDAHAADALQEVLGEKRRTAKVQDAHGGEITVAIEARTETSVSEDTVLDILGTFVIRAQSEADAKANGGLLVTSAETQRYAIGVRDGIFALRGLLGASLPWKTTALTQLGKDLQAAGEGDLAGRLDAAWARVPKGEPVATLKVKPAPAPEADAPAPEATPMPAGPES